MEVLGLRRDLAKGADRLVRPEIRVDGDELRGHHAAGGIRAVEHQLADLGGVRGIHLDKDGVRGVGVPGLDLCQDVGGVVRVDLFEDFCRLQGRHPRQDAGGVAIVQSGQQDGK